MFFIGKQVDAKRDFKRAKLQAEREQSILTGIVCLSIRLALRISIREEAGKVFLLFKNKQLMVIEHLFSVLINVDQDNLSEL